MFGVCFGAHGDANVVFCLSAFLSSWFFERGFGTVKRNVPVYSAKSQSIGTNFAEEFGFWRTSTGEWVRKVLLFDSDYAHA